MKIINKVRGSDKTTSLIYTSYTTGYPIIAANEQRRHNILCMADQLGVDVKVETVDMWDKQMSKYYPRTKILLDDVDEILEQVLTSFFGGREIVACTMSIPCEEGRLKKKKDTENQNIIEQTSSTI